MSARSLSLSLIAPHHHNQCAAIIVLNKHLQLSVQSINETIKIIIITIMPQNFINKKRSFAAPSLGFILFLCMLIAFH